MYSVPDYTLYVIVFLLLCMYTTPDPLKPANFQSLASRPGMGDFAATFPRQRQAAFRKSSLSERRNIDLALLAATVYPESSLEHFLVHFNVSGGSKAPESESTPVSKVASVALHPREQTQWWLQRRLAAAMSYYAESCSTR